LQLIYQIQQAVFLGERGRLKLVIIDEAWDLLKAGEVSVFIEHAYRKFRKYGGSVVIATQSLNDLYGNPVGQAIAENSANLLLLGQTAEAVEALKASKRLDLADGGYTALKSAHTLAGVYSEIFVKSEAGSGIGRLVVSDFQKLLYSTDPNDWQAIEQERRRGLSLLEAIRAVLQQRAGS
jgi:conjugal transfer ATP-binding protein TraC